MIRKIWHGLEKRIRQHGYAVEWRPQALFRPDTRFDFHFEQAAAHLMLRKKDIFFVEIGANDGVANDPIHPFVRDHGWNGLMIEPLPEIHARLVDNFKPWPGVQCVHAAVADKDGTATIYSVRMQDSTFAKAHQFSSFKKDVLLSQTAWEPNVAQLIIEVQVPTLSWASIERMAQQHSQGRGIDVLQIDVEGYDAEILRMIDFRHTRPAIVHYERANLSKADQEECAQRLADAGYSLAMNDLDVTAYQRPRG